MKKKHEKIKEGCGVLNKVKWGDMKKIFIFLMIFVLSACESNNEPFISESQLIGAIKNHVNVSLKEQRNKNVTGGRLLESFAIVPFDITREQVKPTLLAILKVIKEKNPDCEWIIVHIGPDDLFLDMGLWAGNAQYKEGKIEINYGVPSDLHIKEWTALPNATFQLKRLNKEEFTTGKNVVSMFHDINKEYADRTFKEKGIAEFLKEDTIYKMISKKTGLSFEDVRNYNRIIYSYYSPFSWGSEKIITK